MEVSLQQDVPFQNNKIKGCILPWIHLFGSISGNFYLCCHAEYTPITTIVGTHNESLGDIWNGDAYKKARLDFIKNKIPPECISACYKKEKQGSDSNRLKANQRFNKLAPLQYKTNKDGSLDSNPTYLDIRFGNLCNFKCRMCGPGASTSWYADTTSSGWSKTIDHYSNNDNFWVDVPKFIPELQDVYFAGGEPFVQQGHYKMLELIIDSGYAANVNLSYNTNLSYSKFKKYDLKTLWSNFKKVSVWPSVEGYGKRAEYARKGLSWSKFEEHTKLFKDNITTVSSVINIYSISSMPDLILWCKRNNIHFYGTTQSEPPHQKITCLPKESKQQMISMYKKFVNEYSSILTFEDLQQIKHWLSYMTSSDDSNLLHDFKIETERLDSLRRESFTDTFPEFATWYKTL